MSLDCLVDYIGIQGCGVTTPPSGILINSMAGISLNSLEKLTKEESNTFLAIWNDIQTRSVRRMGLEVRSRFAKRYKISNIVKNYDFGADIDLTTTTAAAAAYRGIYLDDQYFLQTTQQNIKRSALLNYWVQTIRFYSPIIQAGTIIKVFDAYLSTVLDTITFNAVVGWNTIQVNSEYTAWSLFIGIDSTNITSYSKYMPSTLQIYPVNVRGATMVIGANTSTLVKAGDSFGMGGVMGVRCKFDSVVCDNLDQFALPFSYLLASELMMERIASDRINKYTVDKKQASELKAYYDNEFNASIDLACNYINLDLRDSCLECDEVLTVQESNFFSIKNYLNDTY